MSGTRWRGLLAPINLPTGDGRRMAEGAMTWRDLPIGLKWQRVDTQGHDDSVIIGMADALNIGTAEEAVAGGWISEDGAAAAKLPDGATALWGGGELFDDQENLPRLTEDVAEASLLVSKGVIGPSVDAGAAEIIFVKEGTDTPLTDDEWDALFEGEDIKVEMLFTLYEVAAATLVAIPAFSETVKPFELLTVEGDRPAPAAADAALVASLVASTTLPPAELFGDPGFDRYTEISVTERPDGLLYVAGHFAPRHGCHLAFRNVCVSPPTSGLGYMPFHRHAIDVVGGEEGVLAVGRITTGFGRVGTGCTHTRCRGKDDHACEDMTLGQAIAHHERHTVLAWVRAGEDAHGLWVAGVAAPDLTAEGRRVLAGRKFSGDWREHGGSLELVELLGLAKGEPAFPAPRVGMRDGRQTALVASYRPPRADRAVATHNVLARTVADMVVADLRAAGVVPAPAAEVPDAVTAADSGHTGAMIALVPSADDAGRLAVDGGEPADDLHLTLAYLGEASEIDEDTRAAIVSTVEAAAANWGGPLAADAFAVNLFNPGDANDRETCIVYGISGEPVDQAHTDVEAALADVFTGPDQHAPFAAHVTAIYSEDTGLVEELADRVGPVTFDRIRVAFAGDNIDIPLGSPDDAGDHEADTAAALLSEVEAALDGVDAHARGIEAAEILRALDEVVV